MTSEYILNLTQHLATRDQREVGVIDLPEDKQDTLRTMLTFTTIPPWGHVIQRADAIAALAREAAPYVKTAMIGGAPFLMSPLARSLHYQGFRVFFAFSKRESVEEVQPDGSVVKRNVFRHIGFVEQRSF